MNIFIKTKKKILKFPSSLEIYYCLASLSVTLVACLPPFRSLQSISYWIKGYYFVNYFDLGFIKRGLVGTIIKISNLSDYLSPSLLVLFCHIFFVVNFSIIFWIYIKDCFKNFKIRDKIFYYSLFLLSPVLFLRLGYEIGRMDLYLLLISLLAIISIHKKFFPFIQNSFLISFCISIQLLIHDASILFYSPLIFSFYFFKYSYSINTHFKKILLIFSIPVFIGLLLLIFGKYELGAVQLETYLSNISPELSGSMRMELTNTFIQNSLAGLDLLTFKGFLGGNYLITLYYAFLMFILIKYVKLPCFLKLSVFTPLGVSFLAMDHTRYLAISAICCNLLFLIGAGEFKLNTPKKFRLYFYVFLGNTLNIILKTIDLHLHKHQIILNKEFDNFDWNT